MKIKSEFYVLPEIQFVGGETQDLSFSFVRDSGENAELSDATGVFSVSDYVNKAADPVVTKTVSMSVSQDGAYNVLNVTLSPSDTVNLSGKFIYQITIRDAQNNCAIPSQGLIFIARNIDKSAISAS